jgi:hypothetical protein
MDQFANEAVCQLESLEKQYVALRESVETEDDSTSALRTALNMSFLAAIERMSGKGSQYIQHAHEIVATWYEGPTGSTAAVGLYGICSALRAAVEGGYPTSVAELVHASVFADYLEMAAHLVHEGYEDDPAPAPSSRQRQSDCSPMRSKTSIAARSQLNASASRRMRSLTSSARSKVDLASIIPGSISTMPI